MAGNSNRPGCHEHSCLATTTRSTAQSAIAAVLDFTVTILFSRHTIVVISAGFTNTGPWPSFLSLLLSVVWRCPSMDAPEKLLYELQLMLLLFSVTVFLVRSVEKWGTIFTTTRFRHHDLVNQNKRQVSKEYERLSMRSNNLRWLKGR